MAPSIEDKKIDAGDDEGVVRYRLETDRLEDSGNGEPAAISVTVNGREYTVTDNPGGSPVSETAVDELKARAKALGFKLVKM